MSEFVSESTKSPATPARGGDELREALATGNAREGCSGTMTLDRAIYFLARFKREEKLLGPHEQWAIDFTTAILAALASTDMAGAGEGLILDQYDAGLLGDGGGGDVDWWQDYIRAELGRAYEFYSDQVMGGRA